MLKFRMTNSMRARRAAEEQRKVLEEKLKMEWAWKPMAAVMNDKESDLVYWVPPLYTSNLLTSFSASTSVSSSLTSTPSSSFKRASSIRRPPPTVCQTSPTRRRKLAQRRSKLSLEQNIQQVDYELNEIDKIEKRRKSELVADEDRESGIHDSSLDEINPINESRRRTDNLRSSLRNLDQPKRKLSKKQKKIKAIPPLSKVIEKLSQIYTLPVVPHPPMYGCTRHQKPKELRTSSTVKPKRPSVKVYRVPSQRTSLRRKIAEEEEPQKPFYVITKNKTPFSNLRQRSSVNSKTSSGYRTHIGLPTMSEHELQNAHLDMILKILSSLYEEKIIEQNSQILHLKSKLQLQEKVIKQTAHLVLDLKDHMRTVQAKMDFTEELKKFYRRGSVDSETSIPYHSLEPLPEEVESQKSQINVDPTDVEENSSEYPTEIKDDGPETHSVNSSILEDEEEKEIRIPAAVTQNVGLHS